MGVLAMYSIIATLAYFLTTVSGLYDPVTKVALPHVETYWESWEDGLENFSSNLSDVPVAPMGATHGVNIVNIAFADPRILDDECESSADCVSAGLDIKDPVRLLGAVNSIHAAGISFRDVDKLASRIVHLVDDYNLDGVDLTT